MKEIPLTQDMVALVDDEDYEGLAKWKWCYRKREHNHIGYALRNARKQDGKQATIYMHRIILNLPRGCETDHINGNGLDNRKENLRVATITQNRWNRGKSHNNTSGFKGVDWCKRDKKWRAKIEVNKKSVFLGLFKDKLEAVKVYNAAAIKYHGEFACLSNPAAD